MWALLFEKNLISLILFVIFDFSEAMRIVNNRIYVLC